MIELKHKNFLILTLKLLLISIVLFNFSCSSDDKSTQDELTEFENDDDIDIKPITDSELSPDINAYKTVVDVIRETGLAQNFIIIPGDVEDVIAYIENNERVLSYNPNFMKKVQNDSNWVGISVLARQIGHHLGNHQLKDGKPSAEEELDADRYAGFVLQKMGASMQDAIHAFEEGLKDKKDFTVNKNKRIAALVEGFNKAKSLSMDTVVVNKIKIPEKTNINTTEKKVNVSVKKQPEYVYKVYLAIDNKFYYIDDADGVFEEKDNGTFVKVGEKRTSTRPGFDWLFIKGENSYGVDLKGRLWVFSTDGNFKVIGQAVKIN
ncbi:MAG: hypothetical protein RLZZ414_2169 [Bacteroidota bacterium]|jgi:hypothetical protein